MSIHDVFNSAMRFANDFFSADNVELIIYTTVVDVRGIDSSENTTVYNLTGNVMFVKSKDNRVEEKTAGVIDENEGLFDVDWRQFCDNGLGDFDQGIVNDFVLAQKGKALIRINGQTYKVNNINPLTRNKSTINQANAEYNVVRIPFEKLNKDISAIDK